MRRTTRKGNAEKHTERHLEEDLVVRLRLKAKNWHAFKAVCFFQQKTPRDVFEELIVNYTQKWKNENLKGGLKNG